MKYKKIMFFFGVSIPLCLALRFFQLNYTIETKTGFFKQEFETYGICMLAVIFAFCVLTAIFSFTSHRSPEHPPKPNIFMSISSLLFAFSIIFEVLDKTAIQNVAPWQPLLLKASGIVAIIYLILLALKPFVNIPYLDKASPLLALYLIFKIIVNFSSVATLAVISDSVLLIGAYCLTLLFAVNFAKLHNNMDTERNFRKLLATGLCSVTLCLTQSVPHIIFNISNNYNYLHTSMATNVNLLFMGVFVATFIFSHFSKQNACE